jgi:hypothetical protein
MNDQGAVFFATLSQLFGFIVGSFTRIPISAAIAELSPQNRHPLAVL